MSWQPLAPRRAGKHTTITASLAETGKGEGAQVCNACQGNKKKKKKKEERKKKREPGWNTEIRKLKRR